MNLRVATMRIRLESVAVLGVFGGAAIAQSPAQRALTPTAVGIWRGTSTCLVRPSACHDEVVVYRITPMKTADSVALDARKIVRGEEQDMGVLNCRLLKSDALSCAVPRGTWHFIVRADSLTGELRLTDNSQFRKVRTARVR